jgi:hypothetical protein
LASVAGNVNHVCMRWVHCDLHSMRY